MKTEEQDTCRNCNEPFDSKGLCFCHIEYDPTPSHSEEATCKKCGLTDCPCEFTELPPHSEETETTENTGKQLHEPPFVTDGDNVTLYYDEYMKFLASSRSVQSDNGAKQKRIEELEHMVRLYRNLVGNTGYSITKEYASQLYKDSGELLTPPIDTKP